MSFRCRKCNRALKDGQIPVMVVTEQRPRSYPPVFEDGKLKYKGGDGWEIVEEVQMCRPCASEPIPQE